MMEITKRGEWGEMLVTVEMTEREAEVLMDLTGWVRGDPHGPRAATQEMHYGLADLGLGTRDYFKIREINVEAVDHWPQEKD